MNLAYQQFQKTIENRQADQVGSETPGYLHHLKLFFLIEQQDHSKLMLERSL